MTTIDDNDNAITTITTTTHGDNDNDDDFNDNDEDDDDDEDDEDDDDDNVEDNKVDPEDMVRFAQERPIHMATYSVSDAVATSYL